MKSKTRGIVIWSLLSFLITVGILSAGCALLFMMTSLQESQRPLVAHIVLYIGVLVVGYQCGANLHKKGFLYGIPVACCGCILFLITTLFLQHQFAAGFSGILLYFIKFVLIAGIGAMFGQAKYHRRRKARKTSSYNVR